LLQIIIKYANEYLLTIPRLAGTQHRFPGS